MATTPLDAAYVREAFKFELGKIANPAIRKLTLITLQRAHRRFFTGPSSSTGKYHPPDEFTAGVSGDVTGAPMNGEGSPYGGQVLHARRVAAFAHTLCRARGWCGIEYDLTIAAALAHDAAQYEEGNKWTVEMHEGLIRPLIADLHDDPLLGHYWLDFVEACEGHSGRFGYRLPASLVEQVVHDADLLASRRHIGGIDPDTVWKEEQ